MEGPKTSKETMRAARVIEKGRKYTITNVPRPEAHKGHVVIEMRAAGFCHTVNPLYRTWNGANGQDMLTARGFYGGGFPITGSHEAGGIVSEVGEGVDNVKVGDRVIALNQVYQCGDCWDCRKADPAFCEKSTLAGLHVNGCFSQYWEALAKNVVRIPDHLTFEQAAPLTCAGITMFGAIEKADLKPGQVLGISGIGALGHIGVQMAKAMGLIVVAIDARSGPLELCHTFKHTPDIYVDVREKDEQAVREEIQDHMTKLGLDTFRPLGCDDVLRLDRAEPAATIITAESDPAITYALNVTARHGTLVVLSQPDVVKIPSGDLIFKHITVKGSLQNGVDVLQRTSDFVAEHDIQIVTKSWSLDQVNDMWSHQESPDMIGKNVILF